MSDLTLILLVGTVATIALLVLLRWVQATQRRETQKLSKEISVSDKHEELFHYTSISALRGILETNSLWATEANHLNDSSELTLMWDAVEEWFPKFYEEEIKKFLCRYPEHKERIESIGGAAEIARLDGAAMFDELRTRLHESVSFYVTSFTTHSGAHERDPYHIEHGMLSQWRGYARGEGVAIVFDAGGMEELRQEECKLFDFWPCFLKGVHYLTDGEHLEELFPKLPLSIRSFLHEFIGKPDRRVAQASKKRLLAEVYEEFVDGIPRLKHEGFHEECERRIVIGVPTEVLRNAKLKSGANESDPIKEIHHRSGRCGSVPYISLFEDLGQDLPIRRVIVGPSRNQDAHFEMVQELVKNRGIQVQKSGTPYVGSA